MHILRLSRSSIKVEFFRITSACIVIRSEACLVDSIALDSKHNYSSKHRYRVPVSHPANLQMGTFFVS